MSADRADAFWNYLLDDNKPRSTFGRVVRFIVVPVVGLLWLAAFLALVVGYSACQAWLGDAYTVRVDPGIERVTNEDEMRLYQEEEIVVPDNGGT